VENIFGFLDGTLVDEVKIKEKFNIQNFSAQNTFKNLNHLPQNSAHSLTISSNRFRYL
jgi:hypothetical protein